MRGIAARGMAWTAIGAAIAVALASPPAGAEINGCSNGICVIAEGETHDRDLYLFAQGLNIDGTLDGDAIVFGQNVSVNGTVTQDLNCFAQSVLLAGEVHDDVRVACQDLQISGTVRGDVLVAAGNVLINDGAVIEGNLLVAAGTITLDGKVMGDAKVAAGVMTMNGVVEGDADFGTDGRITFGENARIGGDLDYEGPLEPNLDRGVVGGSVTYSPPKPNVKAAKDLPNAAKAVIHIFLFIAALVTGSILIALTSDHAKRTAEKIRTRPLKSLGIGFIAFICIPIVILIGVVLLVTIQLSFVLALAYLIAVYIAKFYVAIWIGNLITKRGGRMDVSPVPAMLLGLVIIYIVTAIPVAGTLVAFLTVFLGLGALLQRKETRLETAFESPPAPAAPPLPNGFPAPPQPPAGA